MPDYQKGKIYKVYCLTGGNEDVYYGSTVQTLAQRMTKHRADFTKKVSNYTSRFVFEKFGVENCIIELVENYPCNTVEELRAREGYYQRNNPCVNKAIAGRSRKEWNKENPNSNKKACEKYRITHNIECKERQKTYRETHIKERKQKERVQYTCECGSVFNYSSRGLHNKSNKHTDYEKSIVTGV